MRIIKHPYCVPEWGKDEPLKPMAPQQTSSCGTQVMQRSLGRWHPALLLQEDQPVTCSQLGPGVSIWPGRIVGSHRPQLPSNIIPGDLHAQPANQYTAFICLPYGRRDAFLIFMQRKSSRHHWHCGCHSSWTAVCHAGTMAGPPMPAEVMRSFPDADSHASMVRSLGVCNDRGTYPGELIRQGTPCHVKIQAVCAKQGTSSACHHTLQPGGTRNHSLSLVPGCQSKRTGSQPYKQSVSGIIPRPRELIACRAAQKLP